MNQEERLLVVLAEECTEIAHRCMLALKFGLHGKQPGHDKINIVRIRRRIGDFTGAVEMFQEGCGVDLTPLSDDVEWRKSRIKDFLRKSQDVATEDAGKSNRSNT